AAANRPSPTTAVITPRLLFLEPTGMPQTLEDTTDNSRNTTKITAHAVTAQSPPPSDQPHPPQPETKTTWAAAVSSTKEKATNRDRGVRGRRRDLPLLHRSYTPAALLLPRTPAVPPGRRPRG